MHDPLYKVCKYRANLNGEQKNTDRFLGSNLQCCLHTTILLAVKYSAELNKYVLLMRVICKKYRLRGEANFPHPLWRLWEICLSSQPVFFANNPH